MTFLREIIELYLKYGNFLEYFMTTLNKETKNKTSVLKMQLSAEQRVFAVTPVTKPVAI